MRINISIESAMKKYKKKIKVYVNDEGFIVINSKKDSDIEFVLNYLAQNFFRDKLEKSKSNKIF